MKYASSGRLSRDNPGLRPALSRDSNRDPKVEIEASRSVRTTVPRPDYSRTGLGNQAWVVRFEWSQSIDPEDDEQGQGRRHTDSRGTSS
jgi:hypothetical protein